jgi:uncharacterized hydrophobic protein (TIGR00271 family)
MEQPTELPVSGRHPIPKQFNVLRERLANSFGISAARREEIYLELSKSATLRDPSYWLQLFFAAGIATLGLVLNSPAVIIGAMLISPLMGPILAGGLAFAAGDLILGIRAMVMLAISSLTAVAFAMLLVWLLPFREMTAEIAGRTQPTTLDLAIALFSGAIGSIAICREVKGVVTSIPGVAIAVALMPPLCVVGYGAGTALSQSDTEGWRIAGGGGLLFLTNLVAITFTAMMVFLALHIDTQQVREKVREWRREDQESVFTRYLLMRFRLTDRMRNIGGLRSRMMMVVGALILLVIPLTRTLSQLRTEIARQHQENHIRRTATQIWQQYFEKLANGEPRAYLDTVTVAATEEQLQLQLRVFDSQPYTETEKTTYTRLLAERLGRAADTIQLQLIEVPTSAALLSVKARSEIASKAPPTVAELRTSFWQGINTALQGLRLPPAAQLLGYRVVTGTNNQTQVVLEYLSDREIERDAQDLLEQDIRARFASPTSEVRFERIAATFGPLEFRRKASALPAAAFPVLEEVARLLKQQPTLRAEITASAEPKEPAELAAQRAQTVLEFLREKSGIPADRITTVNSVENRRTVMLRLLRMEAKK